jgi:hypothetical protein
MSKKLTKKQVRKIARKEAKKVVAGWWDGTYRIPVKDDDNG